MIRLVVVVAVLLALGACGKSSSEKPRGLPPPDKVQLPEPKVGETLGKTNAVAPQGKPRAAFGGGSDPHAGLDIANDPRAGMFAKADDGTEAAGDDPHAGGGVAVDPSKFLRGTITLDAKLGVEAKPGDIIFVGVASKAEGKTLALARFDVAQLPMPFSIDADSAIFTGAFDGEVVVVARLDRDGEARTRGAGDIEGAATATIPAEGVAVTLSSVLK